MAETREDEVENLGSVCDHGASPSAWLKVTNFISLWSSYRNKNCRYSVNL